MIEYEFYSKEVSSKYCILEKSALDYSQKISILSNELVRRLFNTKETISQLRKDEIVDDFSWKLLRSGYSISSARQILTSFTSTLVKLRVRFDFHLTFT